MKYNEDIESSEINADGSKYKYFKWRHSDSVQMLVNNTISIPVENSVKQLQENPELLHVYLGALFG